MIFGAIRQQDEEKVRELVRAHTKEAAGYGALLNVRMEGRRIPRSPQGIEARALFNRKDVPAVARSYEWPPTVFEPSLVTRVSILARDTEELDGILFCAS